VCEMEDKYFLYLTFNKRNFCSLEAFVFYFVLAYIDTESVERFSAFYSPYNFLQFNVH